MLSFRAVTLQLESSVFAIFQYVISNRKMPGNDCHKKWVDVFVTKQDTDTNNVEYGLDDKFVCSVHSVIMDPNEKSTAVVVEQPTNWIMPAWVKDYQEPSTDANYAALKSIRVGDIVRVGNATSVGYTDYLTVMEVATVDTVVNGTRDVLPIARRHHHKDAENELKRTRGEVKQLDVTNTSSTSGKHRTHTGGSYYREPPVGSYDETPTIVHGFLNTHDQLHHKSKVKLIEYMAEDAYAADDERMFKGEKLIPFYSPYVPAY